MTHVVVVGAGQAGASLVAKLRNCGFEGDITLIGAEPCLPYQRPPLSKTYLLGETARDRLYLRPERFYADNNIALRLGEPVTEVNAGDQTVTVGDETIRYNELVFATGSSPRQLPANIGGALSGVHVVRNLSDIDGMSPSFVKDARVLIIGGGYIGLEAAAVAASKGLQVTLVEMADRILQRVAAPETSNYFRALHQRHGVNILEGVGLDCLLGSDRVTGARLSDGTKQDFDFVIVGVGIVPSTDLADRAGVALENGIKTDVYGATSVPHIWAAGDCASFPYGSGRIRLESVPNAIEQSGIVAENIMGGHKEYRAKPWFWSDQYDVKLQIAGLNTGYDRVISRAANGGATSHWYYLADRLLAVDAMNAPRDFMIAKRLIEAGKSPAPETIGNPKTDLKSLLKA
ncbi:pyridine nucleotide-disulfide oxidoreductase [Phaeobacter gallaeciensis]|uniref:Pyridine nucleotide-disulfide oxidoreductase n=2 Tax=Roseobacteraceae TaxID=2854170 RepID=A0A366WVT8_9RHOB|nr:MULTISPECIES: FAD/NAD(P)-binding oxidoreductase [Roseobacteraceae]MBT3143857.1 NAD(P)/FAD-dependent oxidoreductase [Falsiruegeria litorea]MBT8169478.1 NAD(P)/FAD-dependent oxidoreductase [Falsiruegeria litorea]RBW53626.1 pyridine nucleotide-disulfide oxidoreductase [Phaeobacter gallaeciensis]